MKAIEPATNLLRRTEALCSRCGEPVSAEVVESDGQVWLVKDCSEHGRHEELLEEDAAYVRRMAEYDRPGTPTRAETPVALGCPYDCGLCPDHKQHTCIALLEATNRCDLGCPACYANSGDGDFVSLVDAARMMDAYQEAEGGKAEVLQISGGEPTLHPQVLELIETAQRKGIRYVMLNTNGLRIALEPAFAAALGRFRKGFEVYLQFDGFGAGVHEALRGRDLAALKAQALENLAAHDVPVTLVTTVHGGVNDDELGRIVSFGLKTANVRGVNFQPLAFFGRCDGFDASRRVTLSGVLRRIEEQLCGMVNASDFVPLPCDVDRVAITVLLREGSGFVPLTRQADVLSYLPLLNDTMAFYVQDALKEALGSVCCGGACCGLKLLKDFAPHSGLAVRGLLARDRRRFTSANVFRITVTSFLDRFNFERRAMQKECVHVLTRDGRRIPFSAYNLVHRGKEGRVIGWLGD